MPHASTAPPFYCQILKIHQTKRHLDAGAVNDFWAAFDNFTKLRKPHLDHTQY